MVFQLSSLERVGLIDHNFPNSKILEESRADINETAFGLDNAAFQTVRNHIANLDSGENRDAIFLKTLMDSPILSHLLRVQDRLEESETKLSPVGLRNSQLISQIVEKLQKSYRRESRELYTILNSIHLRALVDAHDRIGSEQSSGIKEEIELVPTSPWEEIQISTNQKREGKIPTNQKREGEIPTNQKREVEISTNQKREGEISTNQKRGEMPTSGSSVVEVTEFEEEGNVIYGRPIRVISLRKTAGQPLGVTVEENESNLVIARILSGGLIDKLGLLKVGDVILEVNSVVVRSPQELQNEVSRVRDTLHLKIGTPDSESPIFINTQVKNGKKSTTLEGQEKTTSFMRSLFTYDPTLDTLLPCKEIGLPFSSGDILQIVDQSDPNWWQAQKYGENRVGLIPSRELEERRAAYVRPEADFVHSIGICGTRISRKKKKTIYKAKETSEYDKAEICLYEEVVRMPPFRRKTIVLVGANGVGKRTLKNRLLNSDPTKFGAVIPMTSREPLEGEEQMGHYVFIPQSEFEEMIRRNELLDFSERDGIYTGISLASVRALIAQGKMVVLEVEGCGVKKIRENSEFIPWVVCLSPPGGDEIANEEEFARKHGYSSRTLSFNRTSSIRHSSRRARTLESIASLYDEEDSRMTVEESERMQRVYGAYFDLVVVNEDFDKTFRKVSEALDSLSTEYQWIPLSWVY